MKKSLLKSAFAMAIALMTIPCFGQNSKATILPIVESADEATFQGISHNGKWAVGYAFDNSGETAFSIAASKWNLETGERTILTEAEEGMSEANCINDEGTIIGGAYLFQPAFYKEGIWHTLEIPAGYTAGTVLDMTIVNGDTICVGNVQSADGNSYAAAKWINGTYERANPNTIRRDRLGEAADVNTCYNISEDGSVIMGSLEFNSYTNMLPFVVTPNEATTINTENEANLNTSYILWPKMSANGKFITGKYRHVIFNAGNEYPSVDIYQPCLYNVETKQFQIFEKEGVEWGGWDVDNNGIIYANSPVTEHPIRQGYIITNGNAVELEQMLIENGVTEEQINAASAPAYEEYDNKLGTIIAVSRDGKTIIGCAGKTTTYNWVVKLSDETVNNDQISYNNLSALYNNGNIILSGAVDAIEVYDISGALIMNQTIESASITTNLKNGIYIVKMYNHETNTVCTNKIIVK
ncbi:MAG: T9SS type A sorting domain-containing protein [Paludibacteraceae bacterium]|nr:T9SS type A sorting domain-containing protein [Paludibacteraceae bacterium]